MVGFFKTFASLDIGKNIGKIKCFPAVIEEVALPPPLFD